MPISACTSRSGRSRGTSTASGLEGASHCIRLFIRAGPFLLDAFPRWSGLVFNQLHCVKNCFLSYPCESKKFKYFRQQIRLVVPRFLKSLTSNDYTMEHLFFLKLKKNRRKGTLPREVQDTLTIFRIWELLKLTIRLLTLQHSRTTGVLLAGIMTSLYSSGSVSHEQDNPHDHGNCNCDRVVRECGGKTFKQKRCSH